MPDPALVDRLSECSAIYHGSNGALTVDLYARLEALGPAGIVAMNLFRAAKASERAKVYTRKFSRMA
jgi:hypothetical protein